MRRVEVGRPVGSFPVGHESWKLCAVMFLLLFPLSAVPSLAGEPGEGVLKIEKKLVVPPFEGASVEEFVFDVIDPFVGDELMSGLVPRADSDGKQVDPLSGSTSVIVPAEFTGVPLEIQERPEPDWVATYSGDCDAFGTIVVPADGFATCEVTNTFLPDNDGSDSVLTLLVSIVSSTEIRTTNDFGYVVENNDGQVVAGPLSAKGGNSAFSKAGVPSTSGSALAALDYSPPGGGPPQTFTVLVDRQPDGWVTNFGGDCDPTGYVDPALRAPVCTLIHFHIGGLLDPGEGVLEIRKSLVVPPHHGASVEEFAFDVLDPLDGDAEVVTGLVPQPLSLGTSHLDPLEGSVAVVIPSPVVDQPLVVRESSQPDWVTTYGGDCDAQGEVAVPADGFAICEVTNTFIEGSGDSDTVLKLIVSIVSAVDAATTNDFAYVIQNNDGEEVAGPVSAQGEEGFTAVKVPMTQGTAILALDYTTEDPVPPTFDVLIDRQPNGWVTNFGGDCSPDGDVDPSLREPMCTLTHLYVGGNVDPGEGVLVIEKRLVAPPSVGESLGNFLFDVTDPSDGDAIVASGLVTQPVLMGTHIDSSMGSLATVLPGDVTGQFLRVTEQPVPEWIPTFGGDCDATGLVLVPADGFATCSVTNTFFQGSEGADAVLTLQVSIESAGGAASTDQFAYLVRDQDATVVAGPVSASGGGMGPAQQAGPSTEGSATVPLDYTPPGAGIGDPPPTFEVVVDEQPSGWVTNFGGDCSQTGQVDPGTTTPLCTIAHLFTDPEPDEPKPQAPLAQDDYVSADTSPYVVEVDVLANDYDADGDLDPTSLSVIVPPTCSGASFCLVSLPGSGVIRVEPLALPLTDQLTYEICDSTNRCDTAVLSFFAGLPPETVYFRDADEDTYGDIADFVSTADPVPPEGYVGNADDCDDTRADVNPAAPEVPDGVDNDCDGVIDEIDP